MFCTIVCTKVHPFEMKNQNFFLGGAAPTHTSLPQLFHAPLPSWCLNPHSNIADLSSNPWICPCISKTSQMCKLTTTRPTIFFSSSRTY